MNRVLLVLFLMCSVAVAFILPSAAPLPPPGPHTAESLKVHRSPFGQTTRTLELVDSNSKTGEFLRINRTDEHAIVRTLDVYYNNRNRGEVVRDAQGRKKSIKMHLADQSTIELELSQTGESMVSGKHTHADGRLIVSEGWVADMGWKVQVFQPDGVKLRYLSERNKFGMVRYTYFEDDGSTPVFIEEREPSGINKLRIFQSGKLIYEERPDAKAKPVGGGTVFAGTLYDAKGKATHRVQVTLPEVVTVQDVRTGRITRLKRKGQKPLAIGVFADHNELVQWRKKILHINLDQRGPLTSIQTTVQPLMADK